MQKHTSKHTCAFDHFDWMKSQQLFKGIVKTGSSDTDLDLDIEVKKDEGVCVRYSLHDCKK
jgi:hypothetical protein